MRQHETVKVGATSVGIFSLIALFVPKILSAIGWVEFADGLTDVVTLFSDKRIHWSGIYLFLLILSVVVLVFEYWPVFVTWRNKKARSVTRAWTMGADDVAAYIAHGAYFGTGLKRDTKGTDAATALMEAWMAGKVDVAGLPPGSKTLAKVSKRALKGTKLGYSRTRGDYGGDKVFSLQLVKRDDPKQVVFDSLFCDRHQIAAMWPPRPDRV